MIQAIAFVFWAVFFSCWERLRPARPHAQKAQWVSDLLVLGFVAMSSTLAIWFLHYFGAALPHGVLGLQTLPLAVRIFLGILAYDFTIYWIHRSMHHVPFLWRIHRWHHSIENLNWLSGIRGSALYVSAYAIPQVLFTEWVLGMTAGEVDIALGIAVFFQFFIHSNLLWKCRPLERIFVFPQFHRIHHVRPELEEESIKHGIPCDLNYSSVFSFWDRLFATAYEPASWDEDHYPVGLRPEEKRKTRLRDFMIGF